MGMRQRLGIAQAIMENQSILILDEPMNGLDNKGVDEIRKLILDLKKRDGRSFWQVITEKIFKSCVIKCTKWIMGRL